jgi:hypothetical protein
VSSVGGAVRAQDPQVLEPVVVRDPIDVVEDQRQARAAPLLALAAVLTATRFDAFLVQTCLDRAATGARPLHEQVLQRAASR